MSRRLSNRSVLRPNVLRTLYNAANWSTGLNLGLAEPGIPIPMELLDAGVARFRKEKPGYVTGAGVPPLRAAIAAYHRLPHAPGEKNVVVTAGAQEALFATLLGIGDPGDEIVIAEPVFPGHWMAAELAGYRVVPVAKRPENAFALDVDAIRKAITPRTAAVLLNSPCNPTGRVDDEATLRALVAATESSGVWLVVDEIYREFHDGNAPPTVGALTDRAIILGGLTKSCSFTGLRLGWVIAADAPAAAIAGVHNLVVNCAPSITQLIAIEAFADAKRWFAPVREHVMRQRTLLLDGLKQHVKLPHAPADAGMFVFVDVRSISPSGAVPLSLALTSRSNVLTVPGEAFGESGAGWLRLTYGAAPDAAVVTEAVKRIGAAIADPAFLRELAAAPKTAAG